MIFDTHAHLDDPKYDVDREEMLARAQAAGIGLILNVGYDLASSQRSIDLADQYDFIYAGVGVHPHDAQVVDEAALDQLRQMAKHPKVVALGEIGLDYYYDNSPREAQRQVFKQQVELAIELQLPIIVHDRDAHGEVMEILRAAAGRLPGGVLHCFSGSYEMAMECIKLGLYVSFAGPVTFKNAAKLKDIATRVPLDRMLIETDAPYLTPEPYRGKRNESAHVAQVAQVIAELRGITVAELAQQTTQNGQRLFSIK